MRRPVLALFAVSSLLAAVAGVLAAGPLGAEQVRLSAERSLGRALGTRVQVMTAKLDLLGGLSFEALGLYAYGSDGQPALRVSRVAARIDPVSLLLGQVRLRRVTLERPELRVQRDAEGQLAPGALAALLLGDSELTLSGQEGALGLLQRAARVARSILQAPLPLLRATLAPQQLEIVRGRVVLSDARSGAHLELRDLEGRFEHGGRRRAATLVASGRLVDEVGECGWLTLVGSREAKELPRLELEARHLDLRALRSYQQGLHPELSLKGVARGTARLEITSTENQRVELDVLVGGPRLHLPRSGGRAPLLLEGDTAIVRANIEFTPSRLHLRHAELDLDGTRFAAEGVVERPLGADARARLTLRLGDLDLANTEEFTKLLPKALDLSGPLAIVESGRVDELELVGSASLAEWGEALDPESERLPVDFSGSARVRSVAVRVGDEDRLELISGRISLKRGQLTLDDVTTAPGAPRIDLQVLGLERLLAHGVRDPRPPPRVPGLAALRRILVQALEHDPEVTEADAPPTARGFTRAVVHIDTLSHPAVGFPLRDVEMEIVPEGDRALKLSAQGVWGGLPATAHGVYTGDELTLRVEVNAPDAPPSENLPPDGVFLVADLRFEDARVRGLTLPYATARLEGLDTHLHVRRLRAALARPEEATPGAGEILAGASFDLSQGDAVSLRAGVEWVEAALPALAPAFGLAPSDLEGVLEAGAAFDGTLFPGEALLPRLHGRIAVEARDGALVRRPPLSRAMADSDGDLARISDGPLPFERLSGEFELAEGRLSTDALVLENDELRVVASGGVRVGEDPHDLELVVALFPRNTVDTIVGRVPLLGAILQGPDGRIVGRYLEVTGPWGDPRVEKIETSMLRSLPGFVMNGLRAIGSALARLNPLPEGAASEGS